MLVDYHRAWHELRPQSFSPIYVRYPDAESGEIFPEMMFLSDCQGMSYQMNRLLLWLMTSAVTGVQHFELANVLLTIYNPRTPKLGVSHIQAVKRIEVIMKPKLLYKLVNVFKDEVITTIGRLCGTAISNSLAPPAMNTACVAIAICKHIWILCWVSIHLSCLGGELFTDRLVEQQAILKMLQYSDTRHAWPTADIQEQLKKSWKWHLKPSWDLTPRLFGSLNRRYSNGHATYLRMSLLKIDAWKYGKLVYKEVDGDHGQTLLYSGLVAIKYLHPARHSQWDDHTEEILTLHTYFPVPSLPARNWYSLSLCLIRWILKCCCNVGGNNQGGGKERKLELI